MKLTIFLNSGKKTEMSCPTLSTGDANTLARQISRCDLVHTVRVFDPKEPPLDYQDGFTTDGA